MYSKNISFLDNEDLKARLNKMSLEKSSKHISFCMTPSNDYLLLKDDVPLDDLNNPREAVKQMLQTTIKSPMDNNDIIITFGIGLGYLLDETFNAYPSKIFVYEPDIEILHFVLNNVDISEHLASGRVYITDNINDLMKKLSSVYITKDKLEIVYLKNYAVVKNKELLELTQKVYETCKSKIVDINTITRLSKIWLMNSLKNISTINSSNVCKLSDLEGRFIGQTALIIGAGPSLNENIEKIKANRDKFVIFAVNKVLRVLEANGIIPDFAVCLDVGGIDATLSGLEDFCSKVNCISDLKSDSVILKKGFKKHFVTFTENDFVIKKLAKYNPFMKGYEFGGSATTMALVSAIKLGFSKIVFSGLDLAFKDNVIYSTGEVINKTSDNQISIDNGNKKLVKIKSVTGDMVDTREDYAVFVQHLETLVRESGMSEIYNTTSFGAYIEGIKNVPFDEIPLFFASSGTAFILSEAKSFKFETQEWTQDELRLINNIINFISKNVFSPALVSAITQSSLVYGYMQADVLKVLQSNFDSSLAESFIEKSKIAIREIVETLQKNRLI